ncbi:uncharacterized protein [Triticum aestivum]|uniref:uncharacterized protein n=1 Tax=Triticum aestivum TaxID=4565 RepID=UPI001D035B15|nr:uncharacterized protein LOC123115269 [Triticum aestivum]
MFLCSCTLFSGRESMAGGGGGGLVVRVWKEWGIQILVVTSFLLQLVLLIFGGFRRRSSSAVLMAFLWLSYLMADNIAVYALGHMTLESRPRDAGLVAFWATFFLLHLGGQDTITAFSMEDNQLWRRHLLTLVVQASGAGYALHRYTIPGTWTLVSATIVMFIVGFLKYGERVCALQRGNNDTFDYLRSPPNKVSDRPKSRAKMNKEELILLDSHRMFHFCKAAFSSVSRQTRFENMLLFYFSNKVELPYKCDMDMYDLVEAEISLLYDVFYTKAQVIHTWLGYLIRAISLLGTVIAFLLFLLDDSKGAYSRVGVSISYLLLAGAIILETASVFRAVGSTWTCEYLHRQGWDRTNAIIIGQHNVLDYYCPEEAKLTRMINKVTLLKEWWIKVGFSGNTKITVELKQLVLARILRTMTDDSSTWSIWDSQGRAALAEYGLLENSFCFSVEGRSFTDIIHMWQVATDIYLNLNTPADMEDGKQLLAAINVLSNYMGFLMLHPSLLPTGIPLDPAVSNSVTNGDIIYGISRKELAVQLLSRRDRSTTNLSGHLARELLQKGYDLPMLQVIFGVWVELLCYAAHHSNHISHCKQLGSGGEFLTVIRLVIDHTELFHKYKNYTPPPINPGHYVHMGEMMNDC